MRTTTAILALLTIACVAIAQDIYVPAPAGGAMRLTLTGPNFVQSSTAIPVQVVIGDLLLADVDVAKGQQAFDDCKNGATPPPANPISGQPDCGFARKLAVDADIFARVKAAISTIPSTTLAAQKLRVIR